MMAAASTIARQLAATPVLQFRRVVFRNRFRAVQRQHHSDVRMHQRSPIFRRHDQHLGRRLSFLKLLLGLRQLHDVIGSVLECDELTATRQRNRIVEGSFPASP